MPDLRMPNENAAATVFAKYIKSKDRYTYDATLSPLELGSTEPLASSRKRISETLSWSANDKCWYAEGQRRMALKEQIWPTIVSEII